MSPRKTAHTYVTPRSTLTMKDRDVINEQGELEERKSREAAYCSHCVDHRQNLGYVWSRTPGIGVAKVCDWRAALVLYVFAFAAATISLASTSKALQSTTLPSFRLSSAAKTIK